MIKLKIERFRDFTEEELKDQEEYKRRNNNYGYSGMGTLTPTGREMYFEGLLDVEITEKQYEVIRRAVIDAF